MKALLTVVALGFCTASVVAQDKPDQPPSRKVVEAAPASQKAGVTAQSATSPLDFTMPDIDGKDVPLAKYRGDVVLIVNVASKCGFTPQYKELEAVYQKYRERGLRILGFPANNFNAQEPGTNQEIKAFCEKNFGVTFDMFAKVSVKGDDTCELYKFLTSDTKDPGHGGEISWNFTKFLVGRDGRVIERFEPKVKPDDPAVTKAIEEALAVKAPEKQGDAVKSRAPASPGKS
jgi:glutathione peroxidase